MSDLRSTALRAAIRRSLQDVVGLAVTRSAKAGVNPVHIPEETVGQVDGAVRDALLSSGCPHGCEGSTCAYYRSLRGEGS